jgi:hypothetical protein
MTRRVSLMEVHGSLSALCFAVKQCLSDVNCDVYGEYRQGTYISIKIECLGRNMQKVVDRMVHGVLQGDYDYRFKVSYPGAVDDLEWITVTAYPDMSHDDRRLKTLWHIEEYEKPVWSSVGFVTSVYNEAVDIVNYLQRNKPDIVVRVSKYNDP